MRKFGITDDSKNPIILLTIADFEPTMEEFEQFLKEMEEIYNKYNQFVLVMDCSKSKYTSGEIRARQAQWIKDNEKKIKSKCVGMVYVLPNIMIEMVFKCIVAFSPLPVKHSTVRSLDAAMKECDKFLGVLK